MSRGFGNSAVFAVGDSHTYTLPELLDHIRREDVRVYLEDEKLVIYKDRLPQNPVNAGLRKHEQIFKILLKEETEISDAERQAILDADPRMGFQPPNDFEGARRALLARGNLG
jgi:hypothetical protein